MSEPILEEQLIPTTISVVDLPNTMPNRRLKPVSSMIRNCLLTANPKLKELDFKALQMFVPLLIDNETTFNGQVIIKAITGVKYKLESRQTFVFTRLDADEYLTSIGFTERTFDKSQYAAVVEYLSTVGTVEIIEGDISSDVGNIIVKFYFGDRYRTIVPARFIDLGSDVFNKSDLGIVFRGTVKLTFIGKAVSELNPIPEDIDDTNLIDISPFFINKHLGYVFNPSENDNTISRPRTEEDNRIY